MAEVIRPDTTLVYASPGGRDLSMYLFSPQGRAVSERPMQNQSVAASRRTGADATARVTAGCPAVLFIHGGGWRNGFPSQFFWHAREAASRGYVAASIEYRLSGEATFPAALEDCHAAADYLESHAAELGVDPTRIAAFGSSAGGHLAAFLGVTASPADATPERTAGSSRRRIIRWSIVSSIQVLTTSLIFEKSSTIPISSRLGASIVITTRPLWPCRCWHLPE